MPADMLAPFPDIPLDIARLLFETAAWEHPSTAYSLALVSKVVRKWVEPLLYYSVVLGTSSRLIAFYHSIHLRDDIAFFSRTVKVLCIGSRTTGTLVSDIHLAEQIWTCVRAVLEVCTGVQRLAIWLVDREQDLRHLPAINGCLRPTHMSLLDLTDIGWTSKQECVEILPSSLTHLNLDCQKDEDCENIPWQEIWTRCPNLAHIILCGRAIHDKLQSEELFSSLVAPLIPDLPNTVTTLGIYTTIIPEEDDDLPELQPELDLITNATDRIVVVTDDTSLRGQVHGVYVFEKFHDFDSEWGSWRGEDTWDLVEKGVADLKRKRHDQRNTGV